MIERCVFIQTGNREGCVGHTETWKVKEDRMKGRLDELLVNVSRKERKQTFDVVGCCVVSCLNRWVFKGAFTPGLLFRKLARFPPLAQFDWTYVNMAIALGSAPKQSVQYRLKKVVSARLKTNSGAVRL